MRCCCVRAWETGRGRCPTFRNLFQPANGLAPGTKFRRFARHFVPTQSTVAGPRAISAVSVVGAVEGRFRPAAVSSLFCAALRRQAQAATACARCLSVALSASSVLERCGACACGLRPQPCVAALHVPLSQRFTGSLGRSGAWSPPLDHASRRFCRSSSCSSWAFADSQQQSAFEKNHPAKAEPCLGGEKRR